MNESNFMWIEFCFIFRNRNGNGKGNNINFIMLIMNNNRMMMLKIMCFSVMNVLCCGMKILFRKK